MKKRTSLLRESNAQKSCFSITNKSAPRKDTICYIWCHQKLSVSIKLCEKTLTFQPRSRSITSLLSWSVLTAELYVQIWRPELISVSPEDAWILSVSSTPFARTFVYRTHSELMVYTSTYVSPTPVSFKTWHGKTRNIPGICISRTYLGDAQKNLNKNVVKHRNK